MTRRRVLVLTKTTALGGAERLVMNTLPYLDREDFDYRFAAFDDGGPLTRAIREAGLPFQVLPQRTHADVRAPISLRRALHQDRIELVHAHLPVPGTLARLASRGLATRLVYTEHTTQDVYRAASRWLNAASYRWQDAVVAVSGGVRASAVRSIGWVAAARIAVVPNGVDLGALDRGAAHAPAPPPPRRRNAVSVLVPASLERVKGHDVLLDALDALIGLPGPPLDVWLAGAGREQERIAQRARGFGDAIRVHLLGHRRDLFALLGAADVVALPSRREGHPLALLEALALGRPVVASAVGGVPEIVETGVTGLLVPREDPGALADALDRLRRDPGLRASLAAAARVSARARFDVRDTVASVEALYRRVLAAPRWLRQTGPHPPAPGLPAALRPRASR